MNRPKRGKLYPLFVKFNRPAVWFVALASAVMKIVEWGTKYIREKREYNGKTKD